MAHWVRERSLSVRVLLYVALAALAFFLAAGTGAMAALMWRGDAGPSEAGGARSAGEPHPERTQQQGITVGKEETAVGREDVASERYRTVAADRSADATQRDEAEYVDAIGDIQASAVETFLNSHEKVLRYDSLAADDVQKMEANKTALQEMSERAADLDPPKKYGEQHEVFVSALDELRETARLAHVMAADPVAAAELGFDEYDAHVNEASALLRRSNELSGEDHEVPEGVREVSPEL